MAAKLIKVGLFDPVTDPIEKMISLRIEAEKQKAFAEAKKAIAPGVVALSLGSGAVAGAIVALLLRRR